MRLLTIAALALVACEPPAKDAAAAKPGAEEKKVPEAAAVEVISLAPTVFSERIEMSARIEAPNDATLSARGSGTVEKLVELGEKVSKGQTLARIDPGLQRAGVAAADASIKMARAGLSLAKDNYERQKPLHDQGIISALEFRALRGQLDQARAQLEQAQASRRQAGRQLETTEIIAPFAGRIEERMVEPGEQVAPGTRVLRLLDTSEIKVKAGVPERYATDVVVGAAVDVLFSAYGLSPRKGQVSFVGGTIDATSRTFQVEIPLKNEDGRLKPEMIAKVRLTRDTTRNALVVPQTAFQKDGEKTYLYVVDGERAKRVVVKPGASNEGRVRVDQGLTAGMVVIVRGQAGLIDGDRVRIDEGDSK